jgi:nucleoside-diphosphate-sugar epimerase
MSSTNNNDIKRLEDLNVTSPTDEMLHGSYRSPNRSILIIGGAGFLGSALVRLLSEEDYSITVLDRFIYGPRSLSQAPSHGDLRIYTGDVRDEETLEELMRGKETVVNLASIVGDEACLINREATWEINVESVRLISNIARKTGVQRIIQASTCSTYGKNGGEFLKEDTPLAPLSLYAESKVESEKLLLKETIGGMDPPCCILRLSTLFGFSRRPRFDLVVNTLTAHAWKRGRITIYGGNQWRPLLHVGDAARAIKKVIEAPRKLIAGKIYNTGHDNLNLTINQIGQTIKEILPETEIEVDSRVIDQRNYRVDFSLIRGDLHFTPEYSVSNGIFELIHALDTDNLIDPELPVYSNYKWLVENPGLLDREEVLAR